GLPGHDKPASPCLASRFPYGTEITHGRLHQIEAAESVLRAAGFREFRVRYHGDTARLEIAREELARCDDEPLRRRLEERVRAAGFKTVQIARTGFRSGSLNPK